MESTTARKIYRSLIFALLVVLFFSCSSSYLDRDAWDAGRAEVDGRILVLLEGGRFERALELCDSLILSGEEDPRVVSQKARALVGLGFYDRAVPLFEKAIVDDYENCENHIDFATSLMKLGKVGRAITEFRVALRFCGPDNRKVALKNLAVAGIKMQKFRLAEEYIDKAMEMDPSDAEVLAVKGMLVSERNPVLAESLFVRSLRVDSEEPETNYQYGLLLLRSGRGREALEFLEKAVSIEPERERLLTLADAYLSNGMDEEALEVLGRIQGGDSIEVVRRKARALFNMKKYRKALALYTTLPLDMYTMDRIAMCHFNLGESDSALEWERKALSENQEWVTGLINLSVILASRGELEEAKDALEKVLKVDPGNRVALDNLEKLKEAME